KQQFSYIEPGLNQDPKEALEKPLPKGAKEKLISTYDGLQTSRLSESCGKCKRFCCCAAYADNKI
ncbi:hypothetical protein STEG23_033453, partial [Scotinomys teguina]